MIVHILVDNPRSWVVPYLPGLEAELRELGHNVAVFSEHSAIATGDILVLLACETILTEERRRLHRHNLVVHESKLPQGKGWSPVTWQVLEGKNVIPVSLLEAADHVDSGAIYERGEMRLRGDELIDEIRAEQFRVTRELIMRFVAKYPECEAELQEGDESFYARRSPEHSELNLDITIREQFNLLRVVDNDRYPAYFVMHGRKYLVRIFKK